MLHPYNSGYGAQLDAGFNLAFEGYGIAPILTEVNLLSSVKFARRVLTCQTVVSLMVGTARLCLA
jgi:hypothetical protein